MGKIFYSTKLSERVSFGMFSFGTICSYYLIYSFLQIFLTDGVGISAAAVAVIFMVAKVFDAVDDPVFGVIVDKLNPKGGKYLPWLRIAAIVVPLSTLFMFLNPAAESFPMWAKITWAFVSYVLWDFSYTLVDAPSNSLVIVASGNENERNHIFALNSFMVYFGGLLITVIVPMIYPGLGWAAAGIVVAVLTFAGMIWLPFKGKERFNVETKEEPSVKEILTCVIKNKYLLIVVLVQILGSLTDFGATIQTYFATYCLGDATWLTPLALATVLPVLLVIFFVPKILQKTENFTVYIITRIITVVITVAIYLCGYSNVVLMIALVALRAFASSIWGMVGTIYFADCIEYGQYKTGERNQGVAFSLKAFVNKMVVALAGSLGMALLYAIGYVEGGVGQTPEVVNGIWMLYTLSPVVGAVVGIIVMLIFYPLRDKDVKAMSDCNRGIITREEAEKIISKKVK